MITTSIVMYNQQIGPNVLLARPTRDQTYTGGLSQWLNLTNTFAAYAIKSLRFAAIRRESSCLMRNLAVRRVARSGVGRYLRALAGNVNLRHRRCERVLAQNLRGVRVRAKESPLDIFHGIKESITALRQKRNYEPRRSGESREIKGSLSQNISLPAFVQVWLALFRRAELPKAISSQMNSVSALVSLNEGCQARNAGSPLLCAGKGTGTGKAASQQTVIRFVLALSIWNGVGKFGSAIDTLAKSAVIVDVWKRIILSRLRYFLNCGLKSLTDRRFVTSATRLRLPRIGFFTRPLEGGAL